MKQWTSWLLVSQTSFYIVLVSDINFSEECVFVIVTVYLSLLLLLFICLYCCYCLFVFVVVTVYLSL